MAKLTEYVRKRHFDITSEPRGRIEPRRGQSFVIQKHDATRLHYDFRLELDGVLKSWAVPKGPSLDPSVKRLAVEVEDHPLSYGSFEGTIPQGQYGGGSVLVWDRGTWEPEGDPHEGIERGRLRFALHGEKLQGTWNLVRGRSRGSGKPQWLLIKAHDDAERPESEYDVEAERPESVITGVRIEEVASQVDGKGRLLSGRAVKQEASGRAAATKSPAKPVLAAKKTRAAKPAAEPQKKPKESTRRSAARAPSGTTRRSKEKSAATARSDASSEEVGSHSGSDPFPEFLAPQLAVLSDEPPTDAHYVHETKFDGYRALARIDRRGKAPEVRMYTRRGNDWTAKFAPLAEALACLEVETALLDGEVVAQDAQGRSDFQTLQNSLSGLQDAALSFCVFDLLYLNGYDLRRRPLLERKELLEALLYYNPHPRLRYSEHTTGSGKDALAKSCAEGLEGVVCKDGRLPYVSGRTTSWVKVKCMNRQEFVIVGFTAPQGTRDHLGALLLGAHDAHGVLHYVGRVGTGMNRKSLQDLKTRLAPLARQTPAAKDARRGRGIVWVEPKLVAEIAFGHWTDEKLLRHAVFHGLRLDKPASEVRFELPQPLAAKAPNDSSPARGRGGVRDARRRGSPHPGPLPRAGEESRGALAAEESRSAGEDAPVLTHPDKVLFPPDGPTKQELADYYERIGRRMWPYVQGHPLSLLRCPEGQQKECFFQKHLAGSSVEPGLATIELKEKSKAQSYRYLESQVGLRSLVQLSVLEIHVWGSRIEDVDHPIELVFDLDPAPGLDWERIVAGAFHVRELLERLGLRSFLKLSGGKGVHIQVPIAPRYDWERAKAFCRAVARQLTDEHPELYTAALSKRDRTGKIFIDYLRNGRGATFIAPLSVRARAGAPIAAPISWSALKKGVQPDSYTVRTVDAYLRDYARDPWPGYLELRQEIALLDEK